MGRHKCSKCGEVYYINPTVDYEYACPSCGQVEADRMMGQKTGRGTNLFDD